MGGFLRLARPLNCVMSAAGVAIAGIVAVSAGALGGVAVPLLLACLAAGIFTALILDTIAGWWWADPLAAGVVAIVALNEAREAFKQ